MGSKNFIGKVEKDKLRKLAEEDPHYGLDILPYAMLFNMGTAWTKKFENELIAHWDDDEYIEELEEILSSNNS